MAVTGLISVAEYLSTAYSPDCDYVDGVVEERNVGEQDHSWIQTQLIIYLGGLCQRLGVHVFAEMRLQVSATRFRVPDICVVAGPRPSEQIFTTPPFLCIEILSPEDRATRVQERIKDYLAMGVRYVWVIDPATRDAHIYSPGGIAYVTDGILRTSDPEIVVPLAEL